MFKHGCDLCGGRVIEMKTSYIVFYEGHWLIVEDVPARVCQQCGEKLLDPDIVESLQHTIWSKRKPDKKIETPVFEFSA